MPDTKGLDSLDLKSVFTFKVNSKTLTWHLVTAKGLAILNALATANTKWLLGRTSVVDRTSVSYS